MEYIVRICMWIDDIHKHILHMAYAIYCSVSQYNRVYVAGCWDVNCIYACGLMIFMNIYIYTQVHGRTHRSSHLRDAFLR